MRLGNVTAFRGEAIKANLAPLTAVTELAIISGSMRAAEPYQLACSQWH